MGAVFGPRLGDGFKFGLGGSDAARDDVVADRVQLGEVEGKPAFGVDGKQGVVGGGPIDKDTGCSPPLLPQRGRGWEWGFPCEEPCRRDRSTNGPVLDDRVDEEAPCELRDGGVRQVAVDLDAPAGGDADAVVAGEASQDAADLQGSRVSDAGAQDRLDVGGCVGRAGVPRAGAEDVVGDEGPEAVPEGACDLALDEHEVDDAHATHGGCRVVHAEDR